MRTSFTPSTEFGQLADLINELYDDCEPLLTIKNYDDGTAVLTGSTYLLKAYTDMDYGEFEVEAFKKLMDDLRPKYGEVVETLRKIVLGADPDSVAVGDLLVPMIKSGQSVVIQLTDPQYGNSEFTLQT
ncbi:MAG: hypothetical protein ABGY96_18860 [bacterium]